MPILPAADVSGVRIVPFQNCSPACGDACQSANQAMHELIDLRSRELAGERRHAAVGPVGYRIEQLLVGPGGLPAEIGEVGSARHRTFSLGSMAQGAAL